MTVVIDRTKPHSGPVMPSACQSGGCGCATPKPAPQLDVTEVSVNGVRIEPEAIAREMQHHAAADATAAWRAAARALVIRELLMQEARRREIAAIPELDEFGRIESAEDALVRELLETCVVAEEPGEQECRRYYQARQDRFRTPDLFEAAHILIEPAGQGEDGWAEARRRALEIIERVKDDAAEFAKAAREHSACPSARQDGSLGQVVVGELMPPVHAALAVLRDGTTAREPVCTTYGWHVVRLHRRIAGQPVPYEVVAKKIVDTLAARSWSQAAARFVVELASAAAIDGIVVDEERGLA